MVKKTSSKVDFFYMQCGDWDGVSIAPTPRQACKKALVSARRVFKGKFTSSDIIIAMNLKDEMENSTDSISAFPVSTLME